MSEESRGSKGKSRADHAIEEEVFIRLQRAADALLQGVEELLKPSGLSATQYNALRILRGAGPRGLACRDIGERLITRDPDVTRLLDRLETRGWVSRNRERKDRRVITTRITSVGLKLLQSLDEPIVKLHEERLRGVGKKRLRALQALLDSVLEAK